MTIIRTTTEAREELVRLARYGITRHWDVHFRSTDDATVLHLTNPTHRMLVSSHPVLGRNQQVITCEFDGQDVPYSSIRPVLKALQTQTHVPSGVRAEIANLVYRSMKSGWNDVELVLEDKGGIMPVSTLLLSPGEAVPDRALCLTWEAPSGYTSRIQDGRHRHVRSVSRERTKKITGMSVNDPQLPEALLRFTTSPRA